MFNSKNLSKCPICYKNIKLDKHHIRSKTFGGTDNKGNLCYICPNCHRKVHTGILILEGWWESITNGKILVFRKKGEESVTGIRDIPVWIYPDTNNGIINPNNSFFKNIWFNIKENLPEDTKKFKSKVKITKDDRHYNLKVFKFKRIKKKEYIELIGKLKEDNYKVKKTKVIGKNEIPIKLTKQYKKEGFRVILYFFIYKNSIKLKVLLKESKKH